MLINNKTILLNKAVTHKPFVKNTFIFEKWGITMTYKQEELCRYVDKYRELILKIERYIWEHPETGFKEWNTSNYLKNIFKSFGYLINSPEDIPGFYVDIDTGHPGPKILVLCELDALICDDHPNAVNGIAHACGHNAQCAALAGIAASLAEKSALSDLSGSIRLMAVPAEEMIEISYRENLRQKGIIEYFAGKIEFIRRGYLNNVDLAFMLHTSSDTNLDFSCNLGGNGFITKNIIFRGKAAHAGSDPDKGINALYAANLGMQAINALRETFDDDDHVRIHPIITSCSPSVNIIPKEVRLESYIRAAKKSVISSINAKVNQALAAAAASIGATVFISDRVGHSPLNNDINLMNTAKNCMEEFAGSNRVGFREYWSRGSTDMGDISCLVPAIHAYVGGSTGVPHSDNFLISNPERACIDSAKVQLLLINRLLKDNAQEAKKIKENYKPVYSSIDEYLKELKSLQINIKSHITNEKSNKLKIELKQLS